MNIQLDLNVLYEKIMSKRSDEAVNFLTRMSFKGEVGPCVRDVAYLTAGNYYPLIDDEVMPDHLIQSNLKLNLTFLSGKPHVEVTVGDQQPEGLLLMKVATLIEKTFLDLKTVPECLKRRYPRNCFRRGEKLYASVKKYFFEDSGIPVGDIDFFVPIRLPYLNHWVRAVFPDIGFLGCGSGYSSSDLECSCGSSDDYRVVEGVRYPVKNRWNTFDLQFNPNIEDGIVYNRTRCHCGRSKFYCNGTVVDTTFNRNEVVRHLVEVKVGPLLQSMPQTDCWSTFKSQGYLKKKDYPLFVKIFEEDSRKTQFRMLVNNGIHAKRANRLLNHLEERAKSYLKEKEKSFLIKVNLEDKGPIKSVELTVSACTGKKTSYTSRSFVATCSCYSGVQSDRSIRNHVTKILKKDNYRALGKKYRGDLSKIKEAVKIYRNRKNEAVDLVEAHKIDDFLRDLYIDYCRSRDGRAKNFNVIQLNRWDDDLLLAKKGLLPNHDKKFFRLVMVILGKNIDCNYPPRYCEVTKEMNHGGFSEFKSPTVDLLLKTVEQRRSELRKHYDEVLTNYRRAYKKELKRGDENVKKTYQRLVNQSFEYEIPKELEKLAILNINQICKEVGVPKDAVTIKTV